MKKTTNPKSNNKLGRGPISKKVLAYAAQAGKEGVTDLMQFKEDDEEAKEIQEGMLTPEDLKDLDPAIQPYIHAHEQMSMLIDFITMFPETNKLIKEIEKADKKYSPGGPPTSPITYSYFTCWQNYDISLNLKYKETLATVAYDFCSSLSSEPNWILGIFHNLINSRMGIYVQEGKAGNFVVLRELITNNQVKAISPIGYMGNKGEVWFVRILPPITGHSNYSVMFTAPYILGKLENNHQFSPFVEDEWLSYFVRNLSKTGVVDKNEAYEQLMKYGLSSNYWLEFIFRTFHSDQGNHIFLEGVPDIL